MIYIKLLIFFILFVLNNGQQVDVNYVTRLEFSEGIMFPSNLTISVGEKLYLRLTQPLVNQQNCKYRSPGSGDDLEISNDRIQKWEQEVCGIVVDNIVHSDQGYWRLTSFRDNDILRGIAFINVIEKPIIIDNEFQVGLPLGGETPEGTRYCYIFREGDFRPEQPQHNQCTIPQTDIDPSAKGKWKALIGIDGIVDEINIEFNIEDKSEKIVTTINIDNEKNTIDMICSLINTKKQIKFCRFYRTLDEFGVHLSEGNSNAKYSYSGAGYEKGDCGISIKNPETSDRTLWKCYIGIVDEKGQEKVAGSILNPSTTQHKLEDINRNNFYGVQDKAMNLLCQAKTPINYCWFGHPNGTVYSVSDTKVYAVGDPFGYYGNGFLMGECGITVTVASSNDTGSWQCHLGITDKDIRDEAQAELIVRISKMNLVATVETNADAFGNSMLVECVSAPPKTPLEYCRFMSPKGVGFSLDETVISDNKLMNNYFYDPNRDLASGYCSLVIASLTPDDHSGKWICAGKLVGWDHESYDSFEINVIGGQLTTASIIGIAFGSAFIVIGISAISVHRWKTIKRNRNTSRRSARVSARNSVSNLPAHMVVEEIEMENENSSDTSSRNNNN